MRLGATRLRKRRDGEARYYDPSRGKSVFQEDLRQQVSATYGTWYLEAMDAHGGWLANVEDLARFAAAFDNPESCRILNADSIRTMFGRPLGNDASAGANPYYACGWQVRIIAPDRYNTWHTGSLPGTAALMVRRHDGYSWVALMNARKTPQVSHLARALDPLVHPAVDQVKNWPTGISLAPNNVP